MKPRTCFPHTRQQGFTLIELMIASLLGLILMAGVTHLVFSANQSYRLNENMLKALENGRFALNVLTSHARLAGYATPNTVQPPIPFLKDGCTNKLCSRDGSGINQSDQLAIQLDPPDDKDCNGVAIPSNVTLTNVFWVQEDDNGISSLYCQGFRNDTHKWLSSPQPYVAGISSLQILYGLSDASGGTSQYVNTSRVQNWKQINAIKIALLAEPAVDNNVSSNARRSNTPKYTLLDSAPLSFGDGNSRHLFSTTVFLNNAPRA